MKDLYNETIKHCWKKLKKTKINGKMANVHELEDNIAKMPILPQMIYRSNAFHNKILTFFCFTGNELRDHPGWILHFTGKEIKT